MRRSRKIASVAAVYIGTFMATLTISIVSVTLPAIQADLGISLSGLQWVVGAYALCLSAFMLSAGPLADRYGRKRVWLIGLALFTAGSAICAAASSLTGLIVGSAVQGMAGALVIPGALSILTQTFTDPGERAHAIGGWSSFSAVSLILGPILGGLLVDTVGWPSVFLVNIPVGLVSLGLGLWAVEESAHPDHAALDPLGQVLSVLFLGSLTYGLIQAGHHGWATPWTLGPITVAGVTFGLFLLVELKVRRPVLPIDLLSGRAFATVNVASFVLGFSGYSSVFLFSLFLQQAQGWSASQTGWRMAPVFIAMTATASLFGRLSRRFGLYPLMTTGYALLGVALLGMATFTAQTPYPVVAVLFALLGFAQGLTVPSTGAAAMVSAPRERSGIASATVNATRQSGMTIAIALLGTLMSLQAVRALRETLSTAGLPEAAATADRAIRLYQVPTDSSLTAEAFLALMRDALANGFTVAVLVAGTIALGAAALLLRLTLAETRHQPAE